jgi:hypothetical protein
MRLGYVVTVHVDKEGGAPFYTVNLEGFGEKHIEGQHLFPVASDSQKVHAPPVSVQVPSNSTSKISQAKKDRNAKK